MKCLFQEPLMSHELKWNFFFGSCNSFDYSLTSNGLCHTFNGVQLSELLKEKWRLAEINRAFENIFEKIPRESKRFRGVGQSEGKLNKYRHKQGRVKTQLLGTVNLFYEQVE